MLRKRAQKLKKKHIIFPLMTTLYKFALKIEANAFKPILETWSVNDVELMIWSRLP